MTRFNKEISISFTIRGYEDISHDDISDSLGLVPYKVYVKGEPMSPRSPREAKNNGWVYRVNYGKLRSFEGQLNGILDVLEPRIAKLKRYAQKYECEFSCAIFFSDEKPADTSIQLNERYNNFIKEVDAEFDFDIYY
ncbi:DUF4279 domain-containing protein [Sphingobacterium sp. FBM7-1]|uniref:DUF4279 domain-containing protein n=1 Tax=Sphingobacterium sp. FBM7-1 TaxID=2886688 RepID=UPI001D111E74|nr:DUF4279 domain-containing protein [Sphingobacterium sp. FBM7-1]MCC2597913.1 DUF4279 domain-containing protein [Sphingobacterium sp. FBM7-1]